MSQEFKTLPGNLPIAARANNFQPVQSALKTAGPGGEAFLASLAEHGLKVVVIRDDEQVVATCPATYVSARYDI